MDRNWRFKCRTRGALTGCGITTAALAVAGSPGFTQVTESFDGSSWTEIGDLVQGKNGGDCVGTTSAALYFGGNTPDATANSEEFNGTAWAEGNNLNRATANAGAFGIQTSAMCAGGHPNSVNCEQYDGTSWTEVGNLATGRDGQTGNNNSTNGYIRTYNWR